jgi:hypothetical protein
MCLCFNTAETERNRSATVFIPCAEGERLVVETPPVPPVAPEDKVMKNCTVIRWTRDLRGPTLDMWHLDFSTSALSDFSLENSWSMSGNIPGSERGRTRGVG